MSGALEIFRLWNEIARAVEPTLCEIRLVYYSLVSRALGCFLLPPFSSASMATKLGCPWMWLMANETWQILRRINARESELSEWYSLSVIT
jgi:hypothetical protein